MVRSDQTSNFGAYRVSDLTGNTPLPCPDTHSIIALGGLQRECSDDAIQSEAEIN